MAYNNYETEIITEDTIIITTTKKWRMTTIITENLTMETTTMDITTAIIMGIIMEN